MKDIKAIIFDLDGVITDTAEYHFLAWKQLAEEIGIPFDREFNEKLKGISRIESLERIISFGKKEGVYTEEEKFALATKKNLHYKELIKNITPNDLLPGILDFLKEIKAAGKMIALASASKNAFTVIDRLDIGGYFDYIVNAANVKNSKPDPEIFLTAADYLHIPSEQCVGIEDAEAGIDSIKAANMFAVGVGTKEAMAKADLFVEHTSELNLGLLTSRLVEYSKN